MGICAEKSSAAIDRRVSVAPMMDWSDRHYRRFVRLLAARALLYSEMIGADAIVRGDRAKLLDFDAAEKPLALQLNVGCPSERVQSATFGACLMAQPALVADCVAAMAAAVAVPVTVKCRIGIDDEDSYEFLLRFIDTVAAAGCDTFVVHARKAILSGLTPRQNRDIPPLRYDTVWRLKAERPQLAIVINGGIKTVEAATEHWAHTDGVMIGREAYHNPCFVGLLDRLAWPEARDEVPAPADVVEALRPYVEGRLARGERLHSIARHLLGLYAHRPGARAFRRVISELGPPAKAGFAVLEAAVAAAEVRSGLLAVGRPIRDGGIL
ncbi:MAG: tRNA dihydrouridine(20/20a) synthase DusA [Proteobacteria bacterium]|nr:tRNA dihydrouridine(20/20a) synthase DusA [Pseudomonadota bacterium]